MMVSQIPFRDGIDHLLSELEWLDLALRRQVLRLRAATAQTPDEFRGLYISDEQVDALLRSNAQRAVEETDLASALTARLHEQRIMIDARIEASVSAGIDLPLRKLGDLFELSAFESRVLLVAFAPEFDLCYETLYAYAQNDITKKRPSVELVLQLLAQTLDERIVFRRAFEADAPLLKHMLVRLLEDPQEREPPLPARWLKLEPRVAAFLLGGNALDARLLPFTRIVDEALALHELPLSSETISALERLTLAPSFDCVRFYFQGAPGAGKQAAAGALCCARGLSLLSANLEWMLASETSLPVLCAILAREARLRGAGIYLCHYDALLADTNRARLRVAEVLQTFSTFRLPVILGGESAWQPMESPSGVALQQIEVTAPDFDLRLRLWRDTLAGQDVTVQSDVDVSTVADKFRLTPGQIRAAVRAAAETARLREPSAPLVSNHDLHVAARGQSAHALQRLAQKIEPVYHWDDIVLPADALQQLREIMVSIKHRHIVYDQWGMARAMTLGRGLKVLFAGASGTGKTMAAEILANELQLDLYKIDLATVVSKYIGETEKNLAAIFRAAQASNALLFFDEADALFGKRSEVKDAHDRYANIEVAYLLQKMDEYEGAVILATNLTKNVDEAFMRRMHYAVEFPFPDAPHRERIWRQLFPAQTPLGEDIDFAFLASRFELAGGNIRNIALAAAFNAAADGGVIQMTHLLHATAREHHKLGKRPSRADFGAYFELIREAS